MSSFGWSFGIRDYVSPFLKNLNPANGAIGINPATLISFDILDDYSGVDLSTLDAYVNDILVFQGPNTFISPFDGPLSSITSTVVEGYQGYHVVLDNTNDFDIASTQTVKVVCMDNYGNIFNDKPTNWGFTQWGYNQWGAYIAQNIWSFNITNAIQSIIQGPYEITFDVTFVGPMNEDSELTAPANYVFNNGAYTRKVDLLIPNKVRLWTELVYGELTYTLTVSNVTDIHGASILSGYDTATISPFQSDASFANTNGMVRTWRESNLVHADTHRAYLAGEKGIDVFRKVSGSTYNRWGQIFDSYGVGAMYIANFPTDLSISDTSAPYLCDQDPAQSDFAPPNTTIQFIIADDLSAVEIPEVTIYVNDNIIFNGSNGGWQNNYNGIIDIEHQILDIILYPPSDFTFGSLVVVRVVAEDLLGNSMDSTYSFVISSGITEGFGISEFGISPFGGVSL